MWTGSRLWSLFKASATAKQAKAPKLETDQGRANFNRKRRSHKAWVMTDIMLFLKPHSGYRTCVQTEQTVSLWAPVTTHQPPRPLSAACSQRRALWLASLCPGAWWQTLKRDETQELLQNFANRNMTIVQQVCSVCFPSFQVEVTSIYISADFLSE